MQKVFDAARLPLVRLPVQRAYAVAELDSLLRRSLNHDATPSPVTPAALAAVSPPVSLPAEPAAPVPEPPRCPQCGSPMVLHTASRGSNQGGRFWGCPNYPRCWGIVKYQGLTKASTLAGVGDSGGGGQPFPPNPLPERRKGGVKLKRHDSGINSALWR